MRQAGNDRRARKPGIHARELSVKNFAEPCAVQLLATNWQGSVHRAQTCCGQSGSLARCLHTVSRLKQWVWGGRVNTRTTIKNVDSGSWLDSNAAGDDYSRRCLMQNSSNGLNSVVSNCPRDQYVLRRTIG